MARWTALLGVLLGTLILHGCASDGDDVTADGLHRLDQSGFRDAWTKPDADFAAYTRITLAVPEVSYKRQPRHQRIGSLARSNYLLSDDQMALFKRLLLEAFEAEFAKSEHYALGAAAGPEVLLIEPSVIDLIVKVPTEEYAGRERTYTTSTVDMTLLMELRDSQSRDILGRIADRREARQSGRGPNDLYWSNSVTDVEAVRTTFRRWARILRERLDEVHSVGMSSG